MRTATVTTDKGETWTTDINGTDESICDYFLGKRFNRGTIGWNHETQEETEVDDLQTVVRCEIDGKTYFRPHCCPVCGGAICRADTVYESLELGADGKPVWTGRDYCDSRFYCDADEDHREQWPDSFVDSLELI